MCMPKCVEYGGQRTTHRVGCPSAMWIIGTEFRFGGKHLNLCRLTGPKSMLKRKKNPELI